MADGNLIVVNNLTKQYNGHAAVHGVSFTVRSGAAFGLLGPNGAGKTTMIGMLSCLLEPTAGNAWIAGHNIRTEPMAVRRAIGVVPQEVALYATLTARENLRFWARMYEGCPGRLPAAASRKCSISSGCAVVRATGSTPTQAG